MGLFSRKKNNLFDKNIEPKCAYCENGKPARSKGKILCQKCGIVESDYSCKKFKYSPFLRIPERGQAADDSAVTAEISASDTSVQQTAVQPTETVSETKAPEQAHKPETTVETKAVEAKPVENVTEKKPSAETAEVKTEEKQEVKTAETPFPAYVFAEEKAPGPKPTPKPEPKPMPKPEPKPMPKPEPKPVSKPEPKQETTPLPISNINNKPSDSSERLAKLEEVSKPSVSSIENYVKPKEINLPDVSETAVSSIENKPIKRDTEGYLKTISAGNVAEIENKGGTVHHLPPDTKTASLNDM